MAPSELEQAPRHLYRRHEAAWISCTPMLSGDFHMLFSSAARYAQIIAFPDRSTLQVNIAMACYGYG